MKASLIWCLICSIPVWALAQEGACPEAAGEVSKSLCLFSDTMVVGASVSAGYGANPGGPGAIIARTLNPAAKINHEFAKSGRTSTQSLLNHKVPEPEPSVVIGVDLFFWDAIREDCGQAVLDHGKAFLEEYRRRNVPVILGKLPVGLTRPRGYAALNSKKCTPILNKFLSEQCTLANNCLLYDPESCFKRLDKDADEQFGKEPSELKDQWKQQKLAEFFKDNLHPSKAANEYCAKDFISQAEYQKLICNN